MTSNPSPGFRNHPEHTITVTPFDGSVTVSVDGVTIASSKNAVTLQEASYPPVLYLPFADIDFGVLKSSATTSHCPFKGDASYWSFDASNLARDDVMWAYRTPYDEMSVIKDHGAFYPNKVVIKSTPQ